MCKVPGADGTRRGGYGGIATEAGECSAEMERCAGALTECEIERTTDWGRGEERIGEEGVCEMRESGNAEREGEGL